jgi:N-acetyl-gamma-glutamyl-phosphate reductase
MIKAAILGATGYTGVELVRLLHAHPGAEMGFLCPAARAVSAYGI